MSLIGRYQDNYWNKSAVFIELILSTIDASLIEAAKMSEEMNAATTDKAEGIGHISTIIGSPAACVIY